MAEKFEIISLNNKTEYNALIVMCTSNSPYDYLSNIADCLSNFSDDTKILVDEMLHVGNTNERYIEFTIKNGELINGKFVKIAKTSEYRVASCGFFKGNNLLEGSIVSSIQYRMIKKGITI